MNAKHVTRNSYIRMGKDPYRFECPEGHTTLRLLQSPQLKKRGSGQQREVFEHANGKEFNGMFYCQTCNQEYEKVYDKKNEWLIRIDPVRK